MVKAPSINGSSIVCCVLSFFDCDTFFSILKLRAFNASTTKKVNVVPSVHNSDVIVEKVEEEKNLVESKNVDSVVVDTNLISGKNLCEPNDIVQDVPQSSVGVSSFTKYTSPLDNRYVSFKELWAKQAKHIRFECKRRIFS